MSVLGFMYSGYSYAQEAGEPRSQGKGVYMELLGNGITYSFNYDQRFKKQLDGLGYKVGVSHISIDGVSIQTVPVGLNYLLGKRGKYFEMGLGATYIRGADRSNNFSVGNNRTVGSGLIGTMTIGYRREPEDGGFLFRAGLTPVFSGSFFWPFSVGVSFGYAF